MQGVLSVTPEDIVTGLYIFDDDLEIMHRAFMNPRYHKRHNCTFKCFEGGEEKIQEVIDYLKDIGFEEYPPYLIKTFGLVSENI